MRTTIFPFGAESFRPIFWGLDKEFKDVLDSVDSTWSTREANSYELEENENAYLLAIDLPGVTESDLEINTEGKLLTIDAKRRKAFSKKDDAVKTISKQVTIPEGVNASEVQAHLANGILYLALPKAEELKPSRVKVTSGASKNKVWPELLNEKSKT